MAAAPIAPEPPRFAWEYRNALDAKSRVVLPAPYRPAFADGGFLTVWDGCVAAMPVAEFDAYVARVAETLAHSHEARPEAILRAMWSRSVECRLDIQGRITLHEALRTSAGIDKEVRFVGVGSRVELWPAEVGADEEADVEDHLATLALLQRSYDIPRIGE